MSRAHEVTSRTNTNEFFGIGMPEHSGEFHYVAGFEVSKEQVPDGMVAIRVPE
jgi:predicted transcriptional regulator YdeE